MREQKNDEKGYSFMSWPVRSAVSILGRKIYFCRERVCFCLFVFLHKVAEVRE